MKIIGIEGMLSQPANCGMQTGPACHGPVERGFDARKLHDCFCE